MTEQSKGRKSRVSTPLHLLQTLTRTLNEHLAEACEKAERDARKALEKLNQQHAKLDGKLAEAREKLAEREQQDAGRKSLDKARTKVTELQAALDQLHSSRSAAEQYTRQLQSDVRQTLRLAKSLDRLDTQVTQAIDKRDAPTKPRPARAAKKPTTAA